MQIVHLAAECAPIVKVGGLGDVIGALPQALHRLGDQHVSVMVPYYGTIAADNYGIEPLTSFSMWWNGAQNRVEVGHVVQEEVDIYFLRGWPYFSPGETFIYHTDDGINLGRYLFFCAAALELSKRLSSEDGDSPDILHLHDWHTALAAWLLGEVQYDAEVFRNTATVFSIHNMMYQGWGVGWHLERAGLSPVDHPLLRAMGKLDNSLAIGIFYSTMLSTVSPTYAKEITTPEGGYGLDGLLHTRVAHMLGILNGLDLRRWNPAASSVLDSPFEAGSLEKRTGNKSALQADLGLEVSANTALLATVTRLVGQKGLDIMIPAVREILTTTEAQFVVLGSGMPEYESAMVDLERDFPGRAIAKIGFDEELAEHIYGGADVFLMPSQFEPCGIGQMIALRYGCLPVVRQIGGLADTVDQSTGFLFKSYEVQALLQAVQEALHVYTTDRPRWRQMQVAAMGRDFSWEVSARKYVDLYKLAVETKRQYG